MNIILQYNNVYNLKITSRSGIYFH